MLHSAVNKPMEFIELLVETYPEALQMRDRCGMLPLHIALILKFDHSVKYLVEQYPDSVRAPTSDGTYPLHYACIQAKNRMDTVNFLLKKAPEIVRKVDTGLGRLPLHYACSSGDLTSVPLLLELYPKGIGIQDARGCLPLHRASDSKEVGPLEAILEAFPQGITVFDNDGRLPLHYAAMGDGSRETFDLILSLYPGAISQRDNSGSLPLHLTCKRDYFGRDDDLTLYHLERFLDLAPFSVVEKDDDGHSPLEILETVRLSQMRRRFERAARFLLDKQRDAVPLLKESTERRFGTKIGLPDLVVAHIWQFAKPDLWEPKEEYTS